MATATIESAENVPGEQYERQKERANTRGRQVATSIRDIGEIPPCLNPERRAAALSSLRVYMETYSAKAVPLGWSKDQLKAIDKIERSSKAGGFFAYAMQRGGGKTTIARSAVELNALRGLHSCQAIIGATNNAACKIISIIRKNFQRNQLLLEDFPEVIYPIRRLDGIVQRRLIYHGERVEIELKAGHICLPNIPGSQSAGCVIYAAGITGEIRGPQIMMPDGSIARPSFVMVDDPQTEESADSPQQCADREATLTGAIMGLAGPGVNLGIAMPCTVIKRGDFAEHMLDRFKHPDFEGERSKMVEAWPTNIEMWHRYTEIRAAGLREGKGTQPATDFYRQNRAEMDEGHRLSWPERINAGDLSGMQTAWNLRLKHGEESFASEFQNDPLDEDESETREPTADELCARVNRSPHREVPIGCDKLTAFVDVHEKLHYYAVVAWKPDFSGHVVDYGAFPKQSRAYYSLLKSNPTLQTVYAGMGLEGQITAGLTALVEQLAGAAWKRADGQELRIDRISIDANWGDQTETVYAFCRQSPHAALLLPSHGRSISADMKPIGEYEKKPGEQIGLNWIIAPSPQRGIRHITADVNWWKSFLYARLITAPGDSGALQIFGDDPQRHRMLADHILAEFRSRTQGRGRRVDVWKKKPGNSDNHLLDCLVGCCVAASTQGIALSGQTTKGKPIKYAARSSGNSTPRGDDGRAFFANARR